jgi:hypothetical protein
MLKPGSKGHTHPSSSDAEGDDALLRRAIVAAARLNAAGQFLWTLCQDRNEQLGHPTTPGYAGDQTQFGGFESHAAREAAISRTILKIEELGPLLGLPKEVLSLWVRQFYHPIIIGPLSYGSFAHNTINRRVVDELASKIYLDKDSSYSHLYTDLIEVSPLVGLVTVRLAEMTMNPQSDLNRSFQKNDTPFRGWYFDNLAIAQESFVRIDSIFTRWETKARGNQPLLLLLDNWRKDLKLIITEAVHMLNVFALSRATYACDGPTLLYWPKCPWPRDDHGLRPKEAIKAELHPLATESQWEAIRNLYGLDALNQKDRSVVIPTSVSVYDAPRFLSFFLEYLGDLENATRTPATKHLQNPDKLYLKNAFVVICHPENNDKHQARIALLPMPPRFRGFDLRIDQPRSGEVGFDFGRITYDDILKCSRNQKQVFTPSQFPGYKNLVDIDGQFIDRRDLRQVRQRASLPYAHLTGGEHASLMACIFATCGASMGLRGSAPISHHFSENVKGIIDFKPVVEAFKSMLLTRD